MGRIKWQHKQWYFMTREYNFSENGTLASRNFNSQNVKNLRYERQRVAPHVLQ